MPHPETCPGSTYYWSRTRNRSRSHRVSEFHRTRVWCKLLPVLRGPRTAMRVWVYRHLPLFTMELWLYSNHWYEGLEFLFVSVWDLLWMCREWVLGLPSLWICKSWGFEYNYSEKISIGLMQFVCCQMFIPAMSWSLCSLRSAGYTSKLYKILDSSICCMNFSYEADPVYLLLILSCDTICYAKCWNPYMCVFSCIHGWEVFKKP